jgi:DNA (cytosine-5)-methyltransferase 1
MSSRFTFIDLFAGIGGFRLALQAFDGKCVFSSEIDAESSHIYQKNFCEKPFGDITKISELDIPKHDVLCAGFPCQAFSISGKRQGFNDTRGTLFFDIARIIKHHHPKIVFLENVKNFLTHDHGKTFLEVKKTLEELGYKVFYKVLSSSDFSLPQRRERVYIVAIKNNLSPNEFNYPPPHSHQVLIKDILLKLGPIEEAQLVIERSDMEIYRDDKSPKTKTRPYQIGKINKGGQGERIYSIYAQGITLSAYGGGAAAKTGAYLINKKVRKLHPRECLRLQGFPDQFILPDKFNLAYKQLGNSVSVPVLKAIFKEIIDLNLF